MQKTFYISFIKNTQYLHKIYIIKPKNYRQVLDIFARNISSTYQGFPAKKGQAFSKIYQESKVKLQKSNDFENDFLDLLKSRRGFEEVLPNYRALAALLNT